MDGDGVIMEACALTEDIVEPIRVADIIVVIKISNIVDCMTPIFDFVIVAIIANMTTKYTFLLL